MLRVLQIGIGSLILFKLRGICKELYFLQYIDFRELTIHLQYRIVHIIVIYVFCILLKHTNSYPSRGCLSQWYWFTISPYYITEYSKEYSNKM